MNLGQLEATLAANKPAVFGVAAAAAVGLGLYKRKQNAAGGGGSAAGPAAASSGALPYSAGGQTSTAGGVAYDSSGSDLYNAIQPQLEALGQLFASQQAAAKPPTPVPAAPIASTLFAPSGSGNYIRQGDPTTGAPAGVFEVETDGSLYHLTGSEWGQAIKNNGGKTPDYNQLGTMLPAPFYSVDGNLAAAATKTAAKTWTTSANGSFVPVPPAATS